MSNTIGTRLKLTVFGESHGPAVGMTLEGFPAGFEPDLAELQAFLNRRAPSASVFSTSRREADAPEFLSGLHDGRTCGDALTAIIRNTNARRADYANFLPRPSHADYPAFVKYGGAMDLSGGGCYSGRLTAPICIAGGLCKQYLRQQGVEVFAHIFNIGAQRDEPYDPLAPQTPVLERGLTLVDPARAEAMLDEIEAVRAACDSVGGSVECAVTGLPTGLGEPMFDGVENRLAQMLFGIPAVKGVEFGSGFGCAQMRGSAHNDPYYYDENGAVRTRTNHAGGICGGMTTGMPVCFHVAIKPTPSIALPQETVDPVAHCGAELEIRGRHDPCIVPRAVPCVEAAAAIAVYDAYLSRKKEMR